MWSQKNEEAVILKAVGSRIGRFLDIGAYDGVTYSNTMALVERGWEGILVEPGLEAFLALLGNHGNNPKLTLVHAALGTCRPGHMTKFWNNPATFSTTENGNRERFKHEGFSPQFWVPTIPATELLLCFPGPVDVLSIDTEGSSLDLLYAFPFELVPWVVCVEHDAWRPDTQWDMQRLKKIIEFMAERGYRLEHSNEENAIFVEAR